MQPLNIGHESRGALHIQQPHSHLDIETNRYPRFLDTCETIFKKGKNETYEAYQMLSKSKRKRKPGILLHRAKHNGGQLQPRGTRTLSSPKHLHLQ